MGILKARTLECVAMPSSRGSSQPRDQTQVSRIAGGFFTIWSNREALLALLLLLSRFSRVPLCNPIDGSPPGSPVPGILQARTLEWVAISFSNPVGIGPCKWTWPVLIFEEETFLLSLGFGTDLYHFNSSVRTYIWHFYAREIGYFTLITLIKLLDLVFLSQSLF